MQFVSVLFTSEGKEKPKNLVFYSHNLYFFVLQLCGVVHSNSDPPPLTLSSLLEKSIFRICFMIKEPALYKVHVTGKQNFPNLFGEKLRTISKGRAYNQSCNSKSQRSGWHICLP